MICRREAWDVDAELPVGEPDEAAESDDLEALANAVREATSPRTPAEPTGQGIEVGRRGHLRVLRSAPPDGSKIPLVGLPGTLAGGVPGLAQAQDHQGCLRRC